MAVINEKITSSDYLALLSNPNYQQLPEGSTYEDSIAFVLQNTNLWLNAAKGQLFDSSGQVTSATASSLTIGFSNGSVAVFSGSNLNANSATVTSVKVTFPDSNIVEATISPSTLLSNLFTNSTPYTISKVNITYALAGMKLQLSGALSSNSSGKITEYTETPISITSSLPSLNIKGEVFFTSDSITSGTLTSMTRTFPGNTSKSEFTGSVDIHSPMGFSALASESADTVTLNLSDIVTGNFLIDTKGGNDTVTISGSKSYRFNLGDGDDTYVSTSLGDQAIFGGKGDDKITSGNRTDFLYGGPGNDTLDGGIGDDFFGGDFGYDGVTSVQGSGGRDMIVGGGGTDTVNMRFDESSYSVSRIDTAIVLTNKADANSVTTIDRTAANGVELINFAGSPAPIALADLLAGASGSGDDILFQRASLVGTGGLSIDGLAGNDTITGTVVADSLAGGDGADSLVGLGGNDLLNGGAGNDMMNGGAGADIYIVDSANDAIKGEEVIGELNVLQVTGATSYVLANGQNIWILTGAGQIESLDSTLWTFTNTNVVNIKGNEFAQIITGNAAGNKLEGAGGDDYLVGFAGNDTLDGGDGNDDLDGGSGNDSLVAGAGDDILRGDYVDNTISSIQGSGGKDTIVGGAGNDTVYMQFAESSYTVSKTETAIVLTSKTDVNSVTTIDRTSANGVEFISFINASSIALADLLAVAATTGNDNLFQRASLAGTGLSIDGLAGNDTITGTDDDDSLNGGEGKDSLFGGSGNDILDGGAGEDTLVGGDGNDDLYVVDSVGDVISGEVNSDGGNTLQVKGSISYVLASNQEIWWLTAGDLSYKNEYGGFIFTNTNLNAANIKGNEIGQYIDGNAAGNKLEGAGGDDYIYGFAGNDTLDGGDGRDELNGGSGNDRLVGGAGDDYFSADYGEFNFATSTMGSGGKDTIVGGAGIDTVSMQFAESSYAVSKTDTAIVLTNKTDSTSVTTIDRTSANGVELITFPGSRNSIAVADLLAGAATSGNDNLFQRASLAGSGGLSIDGLAGNDTITGTDSNTFDDSLAGGEGADSLVGLGGNDVLNGGAGNDTMDGGVGVDWYIIDSAGDVIKGEDTFEKELYGNYSGNYLQVLGTTSYVLASGQQIGYLTASNIEFSSLSWSYIDTNKNVVNIKGNELGQSISGNAADNKLEGAGGDDDLYGASGNDTLDGGSGDDWLDGGAGNDSVLGGAGDDVLYGDYGDDFINAEGFNDIGTGGKDTLIGGAGNDLVLMLQGSNTYIASRTDNALILTNRNDPTSITTIDITKENGVENIYFEMDFGSDVISMSDFLAGVASTKDDVLYQRGSGSYNAGTKTFTPTIGYSGSTANLDGLAGNDILFGTDIAVQISTPNGIARDDGDKLVGSDGADSLVGFAGADYLDGGAGNDTMDGGVGSDIYIVDSIGDVIKGEEIVDANNSGYWGTNSVQVKGAINYVLSVNQNIGYITAGRFDAQAYASGSSEYWTYLNIDATNIKGNDFAQLIKGNSGGNKLEGAGGNDGIEGGAGNDTLDGGDGNDYLNGGSGNDLLSGGLGDDSFLGDYGDWNSVSSILSSGGKDTIVGGAGNDVVIMLNQESDYSISKTETSIILTNKTDPSSVTTIDRTLANGVEKIAFGDGASIVDINDLLAGAATAGNDNLFQRASLAGTGLSIDGLAGNDTITGTEAVDSLLGGEGKDSLVGGAGNDFLDGGAGDDTINGGSGDDVYVVDSAGDVIKGEEAFEASSFGRPPANSIQVKGATSFVLNSGQQIGYLSAGQFNPTAFASGLAPYWTYTNTDAANIKGNELSQLIYGNAAANKLEGMGGVDNIFGVNGNDIIDGGDGDDYLDGGAGNDSLLGGSGDDSFTVDFGLFDTITSTTLSSGKDTIIGGLGNDTAIFRLKQSDYLISKTDTTITLTDKTDSRSITTIDTTPTNGVENIYFRASVLKVSVTDLLSALATSGNDNLSQQASLATTIPFVIDGLAGDDTISGTSLSDTLAGGDGKDSLVGLAGNDYLDGGAGDDILNGGAGEDIYIVDSVGDVIKGEESFEASIYPSLYPSANSIQVKGAISYVLASDQRIGTLTAGQFDAAAFNSGSQNFWTFTNTNAANIKGNNFAEEILGNAANNKLEGSGGNDYLTGFAGNDTLDGGSGNDDLEGSDGNDLILGGEGDDVLRADYGAYVLDVIGRVGSGGKDTLVGGSGNDVAYMQYEESIYSVIKTDTAIVLTNRNDSSSVTTIDTTQANGVELVVFGFDGEADFPLTQSISVADLLAGAASAKDDVLYQRGSGSYNGSTKVFTSSGVANTTGSGFNINGGEGNDLIFGTTNADSLVGGAGNDSLSGLGGNDTLVGGAGNDTLELRWGQSTQTDPAINTANIVMDGGAGDDTYVINGLIDKQAISLVDSAGIDTVVLKKYWWDGNNSAAYVDGTSNTLKLYARSDFEGFTTPILTVQTGVIENATVLKYTDATNPDVPQSTINYTITYATKDTKGVWNAKGTDKADVMFATTGGANNYDGGKGDDNISANPHADTVVQGGEGFNSLSIEDLPIEGTDLVFGQTIHSIGTLSYVWAVNTVEVNMEARIGITYDAKGEEIIGMDDFYGFANVIGGKGNDLIVGDSYANRLDGGEGKDILAGGGGFDTLIGGVGDDTYLVNLQDMKTIVSERIAPTVIGEVGAVNGVGGVLTLQGGTDAKGVDTLVLSGFSNVMDLRFGVSDATVTVSQTGSTAIALVDKAVEQISFDTGLGTPAIYLTNWGNIGTKSADFVMTKDAGGTGIGGQGDDFLMGGQGQDILLGGLGNDIIRGGAGTDKLIGNAGNDSIYVNRGDGDLALGGAGADTFVIQGASSVGLGAGTQTSRILDFKLNEDFLRFDGASGVSITVNGITASKGNITDVVNMMSFNLSNTGTLSLLNDASNAHVQVVSLIGIDTQQELSALMDRIAIA